MRSGRIRVRRSPIMKSMKSGEVKSQGMKELMGKGGRDAASYKSDVGGMSGSGKKMDKLAGSCGSDCKGKDESAYKSAKLQAY